MKRHRPGCTLAGILVLILELNSPAQLPRARILGWSVDGSAGYDSNRYANESEESSPFAEIRPGIAYTLMTGGDEELNLYAALLEREFLAPGLSSEEEIEAGARFSGTLGSTHLAARLSAGRFRNRDYAWDDQSWLALSPEWWREAGDLWEMRLRASAAYQDYDARATLEGVPENAAYSTVSPGLSRRVGAAGTLWTKLFAEQFASSEPLNDYLGFGLCGGVTWRFGRKCAAGAEWEAVRREYDDAWDSRRTAVSGSFWLEYRLAPWIDLLADADMLSSDSDTASLDYNRWSASVGFRIVRETDIAAR